MSVHLVADLEANKQRFIERVCRTRQVWGLRSERGWANCHSNHGGPDVLLFWSDEAYARRHAVAEWVDYVAASIELGVFVDSWLKGMHEDGLLVGVNFNSDLAGLEVEPVELAKIILGPQ